MLTRLQTMVAITLIAVMVGGWAALPVAMGADPPARRGADAARTTTVVAQPASGDERSAPLSFCWSASVPRSAWSWVCCPRWPRRWRSGTSRHPGGGHGWRRGVLAVPAPVEFAPEPGRAPAPVPAAAPVILAAAEDSAVPATVAATGPARDPRPRTPPGRLRQRLRRAAGARRRAAIGDRRPAALRSRAARRLGLTPTRERNLMMLLSSSRRRPWRPPVHKPAIATLLALLALVAVAPAGAWAQAPAAPPGRRPATAVTCRCRRAPRRRSSRRGRPARSPARPPGPGCSATPPSTSTAPRRTFSVPLACQQSGTVRVTAKVVSKGPLARASYRCAANRATARLKRLGQGRQAARAAQGGGGDAGRSRRRDALPSSYVLLRAGSSAKAKAGFWTDGHLQCADGSGAPQAYLVEPDFTTATPTPISTRGWIAWYTAAGGWHWLGVNGEGAGRWDTWTASVSGIVQFHPNGQPTPVPWTQGPVAVPAGQGITTVGVYEIVYWVGGKPDYQWQYVNAGTTGRRRGRSREPLLLLLTEQGPSTCLAPRAEREALADRRVAGRAGLRAERARRRAGTRRRRRPCPHARRASARRTRRTGSTARSAPSRSGARSARAWSRSFLRPTDRPRACAAARDVAVEPQLISAR